jgi:hypothetical protein
MGTAQVIRGVELGVSVTVATLLLLTLMIVVRFWKDIKTAEIRRYEMLRLKAARETADVKRAEQHEAAHAG